ncbi:cytochrome b561 domain-containing protein [Chloropicon primus]|uniref:Cytochrome b561 domain-containing protein n=2 Tax=Chloropicon primus TaxID=1764295 RepID=A0A5B8MWM5_9CHLO|nr:hypothetical protein A3770_11p63780 [Chloropicon primus]UPR03073.1 cytochrome b561 domain-containing protein [Chloropicon primus]|eukprot:QDZ23860.1 hypothetical protein A3770_11p63780 [Chloropicon primus]
MIEYYYVRLVHGVLMTVAFVFCHYLGAYAGNRLVKEERKAKGEEGQDDVVVVDGGGWWRKRSKILFWSHVVLQVVGLGLGTGSFVYSMTKFEIPYEYVQYKHGTLGIWVMGLCYFQGLLGVVRPKPVSQEEMAMLGGGKGLLSKLRQGPVLRLCLRRSFEYLHSVLGKVVLALGLINCFTGVALMKSIGYLDEEGVEKWAGWTVGWLVLVFLLDGVVDKYESDSRKVARAAAGRDLPVQVAESPVLVASEQELTRRTHSEPTEPVP